MYWHRPFIGHVFLLKDSVMSGRTTEGRFTRSSNAHEYNNFKSRLTLMTGDIYKYILLNTSAFESLFNVYK